MAFDVVLALKYVHIVSVIVFLGNLLTQAWWKVGADRSGDARAIAVVQDRLYRSGVWITWPAAILTFASGYPIIRVFGQFGGSIGGANFALWGLILMTVALLVWYFGMRPLEVKMANMADQAVQGEIALGADYGRASATWLILLAIVVGLLLFVAFLMVFKPWS